MFVHFLMHFLVVYLNFIVENCICMGFFLLKRKTMRFFLFDFKVTYKSK